MSKSKNKSKRSASLNHRPTTINWLDEPNPMTTHPTATVPGPDAAALQVPQPSTINPHPPAALPFHPHPKESVKAFEAFLCFLDVGHNRTLRQVAKSTGIEFRRIRDWAYRFEWSERVRAYNAHLLQARIAVETESRQTQVELWARRTAAFKEREWEAADKLLAIAQRCLDSLHAKDPEEITLAEISRALDVATKIGRLSLGLAIEKTDAVPESPAPIMIEFEASLKKIYGPTLTAIDAPRVPEAKEKQG